MSRNTYHKNWKKGVVEKYITQESQEKSAEVFLETHLPITHIRAEILIGGNTGFITEEQLLDHVTQSSANTGKNRIYLLKGEVGSGKSHLCQWLEYQLNGTGSGDSYTDEHVAIHISRNNTRLADILDKLYEHIDAEHDPVDDITAYEDYPDVVDTLLSMLDTFDSDLSFDDETFDFEEFLADNPGGPDLRGALIENLQAYKKSVEAEEKEQKFELLTRRQFGEICLSTFGHGFGDERGDDIYPGVRLAISDRLMTNIGIEDFQKDLEEISEQYREEGKRPVLICEDVTTFNVLKDDLLDHIFELGDGDERGHGFDIVLGYTTGWETEKADDALTTGDLSFMKERAQGYLTMTDREGRAYFLKQGSMPVRLVDRYLEVIKNRSAVERAVEIDEAVFDGMYPFNKRFIVRAYRHLQEEGDTQQTPRILLYHVVADALLSDVAPFQRIVDNTHVADFAAPMSVQNLPAQFQRLVKWYGEMDGGEVVLPESVPKMFGVKIPDSAAVEDGFIRLEAMYSSGGWEVTSEELEGIDPESFVNEPDTPEKESDESSTEQEEESSESTRAPVIKTSEESEDEEKRGRAKRIGQFQNWIGTGNEFPSSNRLTQGVQAALNRFYDPTRLANEQSTAGGAAFYYTRGSDVPVTVIGADKRKSIAVEVPFNDGNEQLYLDLFQYGLDDTFPKDANFDRIRGWCDQRVLDLREQMREDLESCLTDDDISSEFGLEELLVLSQVFLYNARAGRTDIDRDDMFTVPGYEESLPFGSENNRFDLPIGLDEAFTNINMRRSDVKDLCKGFFLLKENFVDYGRVTLALRNVSEELDAYIDAAARISASDLQSAYHIGTSWTDAKGSTEVKSFFTTISDYANELQKLARDFDPQPIEDDIETVQSLYSYDHTASELMDIYERLEDSFSPLDTSLESDWVTIGDQLRDGSLTLNLSDFGKSLRRFEDLDPDNGLEAIKLMHEYNESRQSQDAWKVYIALSEMIRAIEEHEDPEGTQLTDELSGTPAFVNFQQNREKAIKSLEAI